MLNIKNYLLLITSFTLCGTAYAQSSMKLPNSVGVYSANSQNSNQMRLPPQVGMYQRNTRPTVYANPYTASSYSQPKTFVDYSKNPTISPVIYENINGYKTPNKYTLQNSYMINKNSKNKTSEDFGTEYYLLLGYGFGSFEGDGLTNGSIVPPMNNISEGLGKPKPFYLGFGIMQNRKYRFDINYTNISGLKYDSSAYTNEQFCGPTEIDEVTGDFYFDCSDLSPVSGGSVKSNALMLNFQFSLNDLVKDFIGDLIVPYVGGGVGIAFNKVSDYTVFDEYGDALIPAGTDGYVYDSTTGEDITGFYQYDGEITHFGMTTNNVAWNIEAGLTVNIDRTTILDVYYKMANYGTIKSNNMAYYNYETVDIVDPTEQLNSANDYCTEEAYQEGFLYNDETGWCESEPYTQDGFVSNATEKGKIETREIGVKLRLIF